MQRMQSAIVNGSRSVDRQWAGARRAGQGEARHSAGENLAREQGRFRYFEKKTVENLAQRLSHGMPFSEIGSLFSFSAFADGFSVWLVCDGAQSLEAAVCSCPVAEMFLQHMEWVGVALQWCGGTVAVQFPNAGPATKHGRSCGSG